MHNTFGERHLYVLQPGETEDESSHSLRYNHRWTFARNFHVSPFNDRSGYYKVSVRLPSHAPTSSDLKPVNFPLPEIIIQLYTASQDSQTPGLLKLTAITRAKSAKPLTTKYLLSTLSQRPFVLFLTMLRIVYQAWVLHYVKRLAVYPRPEPVVSGDSQTGAGVGWLQEGILERSARKVVEGYLKEQALTSQVTIELISSNPGIPSAKFSGLKSSEDSETLTIHYTTSRFFLELLCAPLPALALVMGERELPQPIVRVSDRSLFSAVFNSSTPLTSGLSISQRIRLAGIPAASRRTQLFCVPPTHPLDGDMRTIFVLCFATIVNLLEKWIYTTLRVRFVSGREPWTKWDRAFAKGEAVKSKDEDFMGSVVTD